jgi:iron-sulfur cluster protein
LRSKRNLKKKAAQALSSKTLSTALDKASRQHFSKFNSTHKQIPWEKYKERAAKIREKNLPRLQALIQEFREAADQSGAKTYLAANASDALSICKDIVTEKGAKRIIKSKSMVSEEIELNRFLEDLGCTVIETDLGEWIIQLAGEKPSHITAPALHKTKEEIALLLSQKLKIPVPADAKEIVNLARKELRRHFTEAEIGISGANFAVAESGTLVLVSNEGNARLTTSLPPVHIAIVTTEKFVETLEEATALVKALVMASSGTKLTSYVSFITGPSRTTDIEKELVTGVHGPQEVHIIILDNGRLHIQGEKDLKQILYCLKCGGCMLVCPVFQLLGGHVYGGPVYPGGIGLLLTEVLSSSELSEKLLKFCADCKKCENFCPVGIPTGELLLHLKERKGAAPWEKILSKILTSNQMSQTGVRLLASLQNLWKDKEYMKKLPSPWTKDKRLPVLKMKREVPLSSHDNGGIIYLFQGCLSKFFFPEIRDAVCFSLDFFGFNVIVPPDQTCCGAPSWHLGRIDDVRESLKKNWKSFHAADPDVILTICPTGNAMLKKTYPKLEPGFSPWVEKIYDFTEFLSFKGSALEARDEGKKKEVFYHYPCHYLYELGLKDKPRKVLEASGYFPIEEDEPYSCCGFCGIFSLKNPELSARLWEKKMGRILASKARILATDCPGCVFQLKAGLKSQEILFEVHHTAELVAQALQKTKRVFRQDKIDGKARRAESMGRQ